MEYTIKLGNHVSLHTLKSLMSKNVFFPESPSRFVLSFHEKYTYLEPFVIAMLGAWGDYWLGNGVGIECENVVSKSTNYATRMHLFDYLHVPPPKILNEHESSGQFIPLKKLASAKELKGFLADVIPLLHSPSHASAVVYVLDEMIRNVLEHAGGSAAFACAQYYKKKKRVSIGVADCGIGIRKSLSSVYQFEDDEKYLLEALKPGVTGTLPGMYGSPDNAGAGLFYTKSISHISGGYFGIISGNAAFRLMRSTHEERQTLNIDPNLDRKDLYPIPGWKGTVVGVDIGTVPYDGFDSILQDISKAYAKRFTVEETPVINFT